MLEDYEQPQSSCKLYDAEKNHNDESDEDL